MVDLGEMGYAEIVPEADMPSGSAVMNFFKGWFNRTKGPTGNVAETAPLLDTELAPWPEIPDGVRLSTEADLFAGAEADLGFELEKVSGNATIWDWRGEPSVGRDAAGVPLEPEPEMVTGFDGGTILKKPGPSPFYPKGGDQGASRITPFEGGEPTTGAAGGVPPV